MRLKVSLFSLLVSETQTNPEHCSTNIPFAPLQSVNMEMWSVSPVTDERAEKIGHEVKNRTDGWGNFLRVLTASEALSAA